MDDASFVVIRSYFSAIQQVERYRDRATNGLLAWEQEVAKRYLQPAGTLLDIGCGAGREAVALQDLGHQVIGIDISPQQVEEARAMASRLGKSIEFSVCDGLSLSSFQDCSFRYVVMWAQALGNVPGQSNRMQLMRECTRVLAPGGVFAFSVHNRDTCEPMAQSGQLICDPGETRLEDGDFILKDNPISDMRCFWHYFRRDEIVALCEDARLQVLECTLAADLGQDGWDTVWVSVSSKGTEPA